MKKILITYWSGTGNTEQMANLVAEGASGDGIEVILKNVSETSTDDVKNADAVALGCPAMGDEVLEESEMEPFVDSISSIVEGKPCVIFGSFGWGDGKWMRDWYEKMEGYKAKLVEIAKGQ